MPGIAGIVKAHHDQVLEMALENMLEVMTTRDDMNKAAWMAPDSSAALGFNDLGVLPGESLVSIGPGKMVVSEGEVYGAGDRSELGRFALNRETDSLASISGSFSLAALDAHAGRLVLVSDKFGTRPLYWMLLKDGLAFASEVKALLQLPDSPFKRNIRAFADCYRFGFVLGEKTLVEGIQLLPPASLLEYRPGEKAPSIRSYWRAASLFPPAGERIYRPALSETAEAFEKAVARRTGGLERLGLSLSGGLDSRAILAALGEQAKGRPSYTLGLPRCEDERLTARLAAAACTRHEFLEISKNDLTDFEELARTLVRLSDGFYHPHESTERRALDFFREAPFRIVLRGHAGELAKASLAYPVAATPQLEGCSSVRDVVNYVNEHANLGIRDLDPDRVFESEVAAVVREGPRRSLEEAVRGVGHEMLPADLCLYFYLHEWVRRQVVASLSVFRAHVEVRLPYLDEAFLEVLLRLPLNQRWSGELQVEVVRRCMPALLRIPNSNTGAPLDAGRLRLFVTDKFNSLAKRLSLPGFRHYTEFDHWQRKYFREAMERILFDERTLSRGLYRPEGIREVFELHISSKRNYAHLLGTMVALEIWQREFLDGEQGRS
ncbi:MAG: hypothetical protein JRJ35_17745 [Deltaproteobacteria bacterium]|nr:hypothetical protein [Deltaproteobacteria bacterium]